MTCVTLAFRRSALLLGLLIVVLGPASNFPAAAGELGFLERFALAGNREAVLQELIPGTPDYYYFHCLHFQSLERFPQVDKLLAEWIKRHGYGDQVREIQYRQALLTYPQRPAESLAFLRRELNLQFNHQVRLPGAKSSFATKLDPQQISRETLTQRALANYRNTDGFQPSALDWLISQPLDSLRLRHLLSRLERPDYPQLATLIVADLNEKDSRGFGSLPIHGKLLTKQLDECHRAWPPLLNQQAFVSTYLTRLQPSNDQDPVHDSEVRLAYLERLEQFVLSLAPLHNSLKAHVLFHRLERDRRHGIYDEQRFLRYLQLPRNVSYIHPEYVKRQEHRPFVADLNRDFAAGTQLPPVGNDEPLVRDYLEHLLSDRDNYDAFRPYLAEDWLKAVFAETKILLGKGDQEKWYSLLSPTAYQQLKDRVDLQFAPTNQTTFAADEPVRLGLAVKNVDTLIVKIYEINAANYYRRHLRQVSTAIVLEGLRPHWQTRHTYDDPPLRRQSREFEFPQLSKPGVYVIDFIGGGKSNRAIVRKGELRMLTRTSVAGQVLTVLNQGGTVLPDARVWMAGREYQADEDGNITLPFSTQGGNQPVVLLHKEQASFAMLRHETEEYVLAAGIYVDRESLLRHREAEIAIRPHLLLNGTPVNPRLLKEVQLVIQTVDLEGISSRQVVDDVKLDSGMETLHKIQVPSGLRSLAVTLQAKVNNLSRNKDESLQSTANFNLNTFAMTDYIEDLFLAEAGGRYRIEVRGRTGEPRADRPVALTLRHRDFKDPVQLTLQSDAEGQIDLGPLDSIDRIEARTQAGLQRDWRPSRDRRWSPATLHATVGDPLRVPLADSAGKPSRGRWSLLELRGANYSEDHFDKLQHQPGLLVIAELPRGDFELLDKLQATRTQIRITEGPTAAGYAIGARRHLELSTQQPFTIGQLELNEKELRIELLNATPAARVHVLATRFEPDYAPLPLAYHAPAGLQSVPRRPPLSSYLASRKIGDEYDYILQRQYRPKFPGNMLRRPQLLLNPWAISQTKTAPQDASPGEPNAEMVDATEMAGDDREGNAYGGDAVSEKHSHWMDFLADPSVTLWNLEADKEGRIRIPREQLGPHPQIHVLALDQDVSLYRKLTLPEQPAPRIRDLRLHETLDRKQHFTQQTDVQIAWKDQSLVVTDSSASEYEAYSSLAELYQLYSTLQPSPALEEFAFITTWPALAEEKKREQYSQFACHELNFFLYHKDPAFFRQTIAPYLAHKKHKTFLDRWLLEEDLSRDLSPWHYSRLNVVERILLAERRPDQMKWTQQHLGDLLQLLPTDVSQRNKTFQTALRGKALEVVTGVSRLGRQSGEREEDRRYWDRDKKMDEARNANGIIADQLAAETYSRRSNESLRELGEHEFRKDMNGRKSSEALYAKLDKTQEWVEMQYYKRPLAEQNADLVKVNRFWNEYVRRPAKQPFVAESLTDASSNFTEIMFALAVLDLPFESPKHQIERKEQQLTVKPGGPLVVFQERIKPAVGEDSTPILLSQNVFRADDRYRLEGNQKIDKFVRDEFLVQTVYGCQVVVTNPSSSAQQLSVLMQIPAGSLPVRGYEATQSVSLSLEPFRTQAIEYYFYFPRAGRFAHYPVHVSKDGKQVAHAETLEFAVVDEPSRVDKSSWAYVSQQGSEQEVLDFLKVNNVQPLSLEQIAFRMKDKRFFQTVIELLAARRKYDHVLWSYALLHDVPEAIAEFLQHDATVIARSGELLESPLLTIDPVVRGTYQHRDYRPLVNARQHQLGAQRTILNDRFFAHYQHLLRLLAYRRELRDQDKLDVVYYLLLQDRVEDALQWFGKVNPEQLATRLQYDYFAAYLAFYQEDLDTARQLAMRHATSPVPRWQKRFAAILGQLNELDGAEVAVTDPSDRTQRQTELAARQPTVDLRVEGGRIRLQYENLKQVRINYYVLDLELLFSRTPFLQQPSERFATIRANVSQQVDLPAKRSLMNVNLPAELQNANLLVEVQGGGQTASRIYFAHSLKLDVIENYGQLRVADDKQRPLSKVYVKAYAKFADGSIRFFKDGYTDHRGRFDYSSLSTSDLDHVQQLALLVLSEKHGGLVKEVQPPKR